MESSVLLMSIGYYKIFDIRKLRKKGKKSPDYIKFIFRANVYNFVHQFFLQGSIHRKIFHVFHKASVHVTKRMTSNKLAKLKNNIAEPLPFVC